VIIARILGPDGSGIYALALLLPTMLAALLNPGMTTSNTHFLGVGTVPYSVVARATRAVFVPVLVVGAFIGGASIHWWNQELFPGISQGLLWGALAVFPLALATAMVSSFYQGVQKFRELSPMLLLQPGVTFVLVAGLAIASRLTIEGVVATHVLGQICGIIALVVRLRRLVPDRTGPENGQEVRDDTRRSLIYGAKTHVTNILALVNYRADLFLVNMFLSPTATGLYVIAVQLTSKLRLLSGTLGAVVFPYLSQLSSQEEKRRELTPLLSRWVVLATLIVAVCLALVADPLVRFVFGDAFKECALVVVLLLPGVVARAASAILANDLAARGRPELNLMTSVVVVCVNVTGNCLLVPQYGIAGAAVSTSFAYLVNLCRRLAIYGRFTGVPWLDSVVVKRSDLATLMAAFQARQSAYKGRSSEL
jgi:O-antigen/teichoic acid export membrane protein